MEFINGPTAAERASLREARLYRFIRQGYVAPAKIAGRFAFTEIDAEVARTVAHLLDAKVGAYAVRDVAERLGRHEDDAGLREHAGQIHLVRSQGLWSVFDYYLDADAEEELQLLREANAVERELLALSPE